MKNYAKNTKNSKDGAATGIYLKPQIKRSQSLQHDTTTFNNNNIPFGRSLNPGSETPPIYTTDARLQLIRDKKLRGLQPVSSNPNIFQQSRVTQVRKTAQRSAHKTRKNQEKNMLLNIPVAGGTGTGTLSYGSTPVSTHSIHSIRSEKE